MNLPRCVFCNSLSHTTSKCNSNLNGHRKYLYNIGWTFMLDETLVDFKSFPVNELRFIISIYENFQKNIKKRYMQKLLLCDVEYLYSHIPFTLTKKRMISELTQRWLIYAPIRIIHNQKKPEDEDCPICMDSMSTYKWNQYKLKWNLYATKVPLPNAMFDGNIQTLCGHTFCGSCWELHMNANSKIEYRADRFLDEPTGRRIVSCPMCRHKIYYYVK